VARVEPVTAVRLVVLYNNNNKKAAATVCTMLQSNQDGIHRVYMFFFFFTTRQHLWASSHCKGLSSKRQPSAYRVDDWAYFGMSRSAFVSSVTCINHGDAGVTRHVHSSRPLFVLACCQYISSSSRAAQPNFLLRGHAHEANTSSREYVGCTGSHQISW
jgi:hypothetical protein